MRTGLIVLGVLIGVGVTIVLAIIAFLYLTNRTVDQTLGKNVAVSNDWTEISAEPPLTAFRRTQELALVLPEYKFDRLEKLPRGQIRLPDGRIANPQVEGIDQYGNTIPFHHSGFTFSNRDFAVYTPDHDIDSMRIAKIRIRSDVQFSCEEIFWRNRNPK